jgi:hypothetical protein
MIRELPALLSTVAAAVDLHPGGRCHPSRPVPSPATARAPTRRSPSTVPQREPDGCHFGDGRQPGRRQHAPPAAGVPAATCPPTGKAGWTSSYPTSAGVVVSLTTGSTLAHEGLVTVRRPYGTIVRDPHTRPATLEHRALHQIGGHWQEPSEPGYDDQGTPIYTRQDATTSHVRRAGRARGRRPGRGSPAAPPAMSRPAHDLPAGVARPVVAAPRNGQPEHVHRPRLRRVPGRPGPARRRTRPARRRC